MSPSIMEGIQGFYVGFTVGQYHKRVLYLAGVPKKSTLLQKMKNPKILKKCKLYFLEIDDFMKIILQIFSKFWPTMKKRAPPDQNWAILNKFIDTIRES